MVSTDGSEHAIDPAGRLPSLEEGEFYRFSLTLPEGRARAQRLTFGAEGLELTVYLDGELVRTIDLSQVEEGYTFSVDSSAGTNTIQVEPGRIRVSRADCPDQVCVGQGWISTSAAPIVCLPHRLVIQIGSAQDPAGPDAVTGG